MIRPQNRFGAGLAPAPPVQPTLPKLVAAEYDPLQRMALYLGLALLFVHFSVLAQIGALLVHTNLFLLNLVGVPAIVAMVLNGGLGKTFRARPPYYWLAFGCWILLATPFSSWRGGSALFCFSYWRTALIMVFITGGMILEWSDVKKTMSTIAAASVVNVLSAGLFRVQGGNRFEISISTIGNPNDYAGHLLLVLPFLLWVLMAGKMWQRAISVPFLAVGVYLILATASRGAMVALAVESAVFAILGTARQKAAMVMLGPIAAVVLVAVVPSTSWRRLATVWSSRISSAEAAEAIDSSGARQYTLRTSIRYALEHPLFGVGPEQFATFEGGHEHVIGTHGYWHNSHNSYAQPAAECGIPGFLFFIGGLGSTVLLLYKTHRQARRRPDCRDMRCALLCMLVAMIGFAVAIAFLNFTYYFYLPAMAGLSVGAWAAAQREFRARDAALQAQTA